MSIKSILIMHFSEEHVYVHEAKTQTKIQKTQNLMWDTSERDVVKETDENMKHQIKPYTRIK